MDVIKEFLKHPMNLIGLFLWAGGLLFIFCDKHTASVWFSSILVVCAAIFLVYKYLEKNEQEGENAESHENENEMRKSKDVKVSKEDYSLKVQLEKALSSPLSQMYYGKKAKIPQELYEKLVCCDAAKDLPNNSCDSTAFIENRFPGENWDLYGMDELVWGVWIGDRLVYNPDDYSLFGAAQLATYFSDAVLFCGKQLTYKGDGSRYFEQLMHPIFLYNKDVSYEDWYVVNGYKIEDMFPDYVDAVRGLFSFELSEINGLYFLVSPDLKKIRHALGSTDSENVLAVSFREVAKKRWPKCLIEAGDAFYSQTMRSIFAEVVSVYRSGTLAKSAEAAVEKEFGCRRKKYYTQFYVGYPNCNYSRAKEAAANVDDISKAYLEDKNLSSFNILQNGIYLNSEEANVGLNGLMMFPIDIYEAWSRPFSCKELSELCRPISLGRFAVRGSEEFARKLQHGFS